MIQAGCVYILFILWCLFKSEGIDFFISFLLFVLSLVVFVPGGMVKECFSVFVTPTVAVDGGLSPFGRVHPWSKIKEIKL